jgi:ABC-2 type transport system permease protein
MTFKRFITILNHTVLISWERHIEYRGAAIAWILNGFIIPAVLTLIWLTIRRHQELPLNDNQIITYYFLSTITFRLTQSWIAERLGWQIKDGILSHYLTRPIPYWLTHLGVDLGLKGVRLLSLSPFVFIFLLIFPGQIQISSSPAVWLLVLAALILGYAINFIIQNIIGLTALWVEHVYGVYTIYTTLEGLLSGYTIPLLLMPPILATMTIILPFRYILGFPIDILMGNIETSAILQGFLILGLWLFGLIFLWRSVWKAGIKNYTAVGN